MPAHSIAICTRCHREEATPVATVAAAVEADAMIEQKEAVAKQIRAFFATLNPTYMPAAVLFVPGRPLVIHPYLCNNAIAGDAENKKSGICAARVGQLVTEAGPAAPRAPRAKKEKAPPIDEAAAAAAKAQAEADAIAATGVVGMPEATDPTEPTPWHADETPAPVITDEPAHNGKRHKKHATASV